MAKLSSELSLSQKILQQVEYLLSIALQDDERGRTADASKMYSCAIDFAIQAVRNKPYFLTS